MDNLLAGRFADCSIYGDVRTQYVMENYDRIFTVDVIWIWSLWTDRSTSWLTTNWCLLDNSPTNQLAVNQIMD